MQHPIPIQLNVVYPQRSVLGPLLFIIYANDIPHSIHNSKCILFADDTTLYHTHHNMQQLYDIVTQDLLLMIDWFKSNKLSLNVSKTHSMLFSKNTLDNDNIPVLKVGTETINTADSVKFLGILIEIFE